mmetsp:Transcript_73652/g.204775  ORF Transcript_73652/g.204775 Transcript_73652/m.204775 type:complete len:257 (+) Transcript_73652:734-1504(+)
MPCAFSFQKSNSAFTGSDASRILRTSACSIAACSSAATFIDAVPTRTETGILAIFAVLQMALLRGLSLLKPAELSVHLLEAALQPIPSLQTLGFFGLQLPHAVSELVQPLHAGNTTVAWCANSCPLGFHGGGRWELILCRRGPSKDWDFSDANVSIRTIMDLRLGLPRCPLQVLRDLAGEFVPTLGDAQILQLPCGPLFRCFNSTASCLEGALRERVDIRGLSRLLVSCVQQLPDALQVIGEPHCSERSALGISET